MTASLSIELLNHASVIFRAGDLSLLFDPWYSGTCFAGNWGLKYNNPEALDKAAAATHLWISHPHEDHLHFPTLKQLAERAAGMTVLANVSDNINMPEIAGKIGFTKTMALAERKRLQVADGLSVIRYPASRIDNMLVIDMGGLRILNYNDCNIPAKALRQLVDEFGPIDVLLCNYNHAYKLWDYVSDEPIFARFKQRFSLIAREVKPRWIIPFASLHYYRSRYCQNQNASLMKPEDLVELAPDSVVVLHVGDSIHWQGDEKPVIERHEPALARSSMDEKEYPNPAQWSEVLEVSQRYCQRLNRSFPLVKFWMPPVNILVDDHQRTVQLDLDKGAGEVDASSAVNHMQLQSETLVHAFTKPFGIDALWIGGDFSFKAEHVSLVHRFVMLGMLMDNELAASNFIRMPFQPAKWSFFLNRREEIGTIIKEHKFNLGERV